MRLSNEQADALEELLEAQLGLKQIDIKTHSNHLKNLEGFLNIIEEEVGEDPILGTGVGTAYTHKIYLGGIKKEIYEANRDRENLCLLAKDHLLSGLNAHATLCSSTDSSHKEKAYERVKRILDYLPMKTLNDLYLNHQTALGPDILKSIKTKVKKELNKVEEEFDLV